jgi:hypothetical protein
MITGQRPTVNPACRQAGTNELLLYLFKFDPDMLVPVFEDDEYFPETELNGWFHNSIPRNPPIGLLFHVLFQLFPVSFIDQIFQFLRTPNYSKKYPVS